MTIEKLSGKIRYRCVKAGTRFFSNDNISQHIKSGELDELIEEVTGNMEQVLKSLVIDIEKDHNAKDTARRYAKMLVLESFRGRYEEPPQITTFPNVNRLDEMFVVGPIILRSACAHHHVPITGHAWVGVMPGAHLLGLSKFHRIIDHISRRPQIQEELIVQVADAVEELAQPEGLAVLIEAKHMCCSHRGVEDNDSKMTSIVVRGKFRQEPSIKQEFLDTVKMTRRD